MKATAIIFILSLVAVVHGNWQEWWTYDGISGPGYWGVINPAWTLCNRGRHQSPINIDPGQLVRDLSLDEAPKFTVDKRPISGSLYNTGQALVFRVDPERATQMPVNITGGPLSYRYQFEQMFFHWSGDSDSSAEGGSEHQINNHSFPGEIQLYGFNAHLFSNLSEAVLHPHGAVGVAIMLQVSNRDSNRGIKPLTAQLKKVIYRGQSHPVNNLNLAEILPDTDHYMTYEGSTTYPGCWETVTWIVMNKPIYISRQEMNALKQLMQGDKINPKSSLAPNSRPIQQSHSRSVRTNIYFPQAKKAANNNDGLASKPAQEECHDVFENFNYASASAIVGSSGITASTGQP